MVKEILLKQVKDVILRYDPGASVILYGSRARGNDAEDSDWDFLILTNILVTDSVKSEIRHMLYDIEWSTGEIISSIIYNRDKWTDNRNLITPFYNNVAKDGIQI